MKTFRVKPVAALAATVMATLIAACAGLPKDGRYQTHGGGWDNFRAEVPPAQVGAGPDRMKTLGFQKVAALAAMIAATLVAGCAGIPQDDRYQIHDGGRSNTRAEAPAPSATRPS